MGASDILVVAGEASGDQHAAELVAALQRRRPGLRFFGMGGSKLEAVGMEICYGAHEVSVMGITEVLPKIPRILGVLRGLTRVVEERRPACAVLVDIPDFNLRLAARLKALGIPVVYYISPMVWAWRKGRLKQISRTVERMLCILPFEEAFYREAGVAAVYVGSPVVEQVPLPEAARSFRLRLGLALDRPTMALLPGSRHAELTRLMPDMVKCAELWAEGHPGLQVVVPVAPSLSKELVRSYFLRSGLQPILIEGQAPDAVGASDAAIVASGTAALEAGLMERPFVVVYRVSLFTYLVGRLLLRVAHVALVNLLAKRRLVPELLQFDFTPPRVVEALGKLSSGAPHAELLAGLRGLRGHLGPPGAAERAAAEVLQVLDAHT